MLIRFFSSIRKKPREVRDQYAFWIAVIITGLVATPWVIGIPGQLATEKDGVESEPIFSSFFDEAVDRLSKATDGLDELRNPEEQDDVANTSTSTNEIDMSFINSTTSSPATPADPQPPQREVRIATTTTSTTQ